MSAAQYRAAERLVRDWNLELDEWLAGATCSMVLAGRDEEGREVVFRYPVDLEEATHGFRALLDFSSSGGIAVLRSDEASGAVLMPRLRPGTALSDEQWNTLEAVQAAAGAMRRLRPARSDYPPLESFFANFLAFDSDLLIIQSAQRVARHLFATQTEAVALHGDLHHFNLLFDGVRHVPIDPKGIMADPAFEPAAFLRNPVPGIADWRHLEVTQRMRVEAFSELLELDEKRVWGWGFAQTVVAGWWDDGTDFGVAWMRVADALLEARPAGAAGWT